MLLRGIPNTHVEEAAAGKLKAVSIRSPQAREWLERAYPAGWEHQPYLVTVDGERVRAYAGMGMALRLGWLLGPRKAWRVWNLARRYGVSWPAGGEFSTERRFDEPPQGLVPRPSRRRFLRVLGGSTLAGLLSNLLPADTRLIVTADSSVQEGKLLNRMRCSELKGAALEEAVQRALDDGDVKSLQNYLADQGLSLDRKAFMAQRCTVSRDSAASQILVVVLPFVEADGKIVYITNGRRTHASAAIVTVTPEGTLIDGYTVVDGTVQHNRFKVTGGLVINETTGETLDVSPLISGCDICGAVCMFILNSGCGAGAAVLCAMACALCCWEVLPLCVGICYVIWAAWCLDQTWNSCQALCVGLGYCDE